MEEPFELFGIECGSGWKELYTPIFEYIEKYNASKKEDEEEMRILQVKEKFGSLRVYVNFYTEELRKLIEEAEEKSYTTCEFCGTTENIGHTVGWITTCCRDCVQDISNKSKRVYSWNAKNENGELEKIKITPIEC